jgi:beta-aspartyl-peptidase (threonine type)
MLMKTACAFALHGGAGVIDPAQLSEADRRDIRVELARIAGEAWALLAAGGSALDAVELAVVALEDSEHFNAGRGAVLNRDGEAELDAAIMDGRARDAGAVAGARRPRNPIRLARAVMEKSEHAMLIGAGADAFALEAGLPLESPAYFVTPMRQAQLARARAEGRVSLDHDGYETTALKSGTVGAVARDAAGHLAAATSTGGMTNKRPGRIGDSPLIGCGTYADDTSVAVSATGHGEYFIRTVLAHEVHARVKFGGRSVEAAAAEALALVAQLGGDGGLVAVAREGLAVASFNSPGMYRAIVEPDGRVRVGIYGDWEP